METQQNLDEINEKIQLLKQTAQDLKRNASGFPSVSKNAARILASVKMLELNVSDIADLQEG